MAQVKKPIRVFLIQEGVDLWTQKKSLLFLIQEAGVDLWTQKKFIISMLEDFLFLLSDN